MAMAKPTDLLDAPPTTTVAVAPQTDQLVSMFERFASDPNVSVEKIERLMALVERTEAKRAQAAFNAAMADAQREMRPIAADAYNPQTKSKYASYAALDVALRPIYTKHGFALSFNTGDAPAADTVRMLCDVTHVGGHEKPYKLDMPADGKGAKGGDVMTKTHATGSAASYGMRYLLKMIFNIAVGEDDDDGNRATGSQVRQDVHAPEGFEAWLAVLEGVASQGWPAFSKAWNESNIKFRNHLNSTNRVKFAFLKRQAEQVRP